MNAARPSARAAVLRNLLLFAPFLAVTLFALVYLVRELQDDGLGAGGIVAVVLIGFVTLLLAYQVVQSARDLLSHTIETRGVVVKRWSRNEFVFFRNTYIFVERNVFRISPEQELRIDVGDTVRVVHYPHTSTVETVEVVEPRAQQSVPNA